MQKENNKTKPVAKKRPLKIVLTIILGLLVVLVLAVLFVVPAFLSSQTGRETILSRINNSIEGKADFKNLSMSWWKGIKVTDISFKDNAGQTSVSVKGFSTKPSYGALLTGNLAFGETIIDEPRIEINLKKQAEEQGRITEPKAPAAKEAEPMALPIKRIDLIVNNGDVKVTDSKAGTVELSKINSHIQLMPPGQQTNFGVKMTVGQQDKGSDINVNGNVKPPSKGWTLKGTTGDLTVEVNELNLATLAPLLALAGVDINVKGNISADVKTEIKNGQIGNTVAAIRGENLNVSGAALKGDRLI